MDLWMDLQLKDYKIIPYLTNCLDSKALLYLLIHIKENSLYGI